MPDVPKRCTASSHGQRNTQTLRIREQIRGMTADPIFPAGFCIHCGHRRDDCNFSSAGYVTINFFDDLLVKSWLCNLRFRGRNFLPIFTKLAITYSWWKSEIFRISSSSSNRIYSAVIFTCFVLSAAGMVVCLSLFGTTISSSHWSPLQTTKL